MILRCAPSCAAIPLPNRLCPPSSTAFVLLRRLCSPPRPSASSVETNYLVPERDDVVVRFPARTFAVLLEFQANPLAPTPGLSFLVAPSVNDAKAEPAEPFQTELTVQVVTWRARAPDRFLTELRIRSNGVPMRLTVCKSVQK
jgi:hypothetical protein